MRKHLKCLSRSQRLELWLRCETHKYVAELSILILAAWMAEGLRHAVVHAVIHLSA